jgi:hypothetical protein
MTPPNHKHSPVTDAAGREICSTCNQLIINSIKSSDDPRLQDAGFDRGSRQDVELSMPPLPVVLLTLYFNGPALGLAKAPISWYVDNVAQEEGRRYEQGTATLVGGPDDIWDELCKEWHNVSNRTHSGSRE